MLSNSLLATLLALLAVTQAGVDAAGTGADLQYLQDGGKLRESAVQALARLQQLRKSTYITPMNYALRGLGYIGDAARMRMLVYKMLAGRQVSVAALGGSITWGAGCTTPSEDAYPAQLSNWLQAAFPLSGGGEGAAGAAAEGRKLLQNGEQQQDQQPAKLETLGLAGAEEALLGPGAGLRSLQQQGQPVGHQVHNGGIRGTTSAYMSVCLDLHMPQRKEELDLVLVDYAVNDPPVPVQTFSRSASGRRPFERLLRKLLSLPNRPAVVLVNFVVTARDVAEAKYWENAERDFYELATYYNLPTLSFKAATFHAMRAGEPGFNLTSLFGNHGTTHPVRAAHTVTVELLGTLIEKLVEEVAHGSLEGGAIRAPGGDSAAAAAAASTTAAWAAAAAAPLPPPLMPQNYESSGSLCFMDMPFRGLAVSFKNWNWTDEGLGMGKLGWVSTTVGASLQLKVNTKAPPGAASASDSVVVSVAHLKSYAHMGMANVSCVSGCSCDTLTVDGWYWRKASLTHMADVAVSQHAECVMQVTILPQTKSGKGAHKFKVMGVTVNSEDAGAASGLVKFVRDDSMKLAAAVRKGKAGSAGVTTARHNRQRIKVTQAAAAAAAKPAA